MSEAKNRLYLEGNEWVIVFDGVETRLPDSEEVHDGFVMLQALLRSPGRAFSPEELLDIAAARPLRAIE